MVWPVAVVVTWTLMGVQTAGQGSGLPVGALLARAEAYLDAYEIALASVVAEERYDQLVQYYSIGPTGGRIVSPGSSTWTRRRRLVSDYLLVRIPGSAGWQPFRDVMEVDGQPVRDRENRLIDLFVNPASLALDQAARIADESARFNIGNVSRTINVPTLALVFLRNRYRLEFRLQGERKIGGVQTVGVAFRERQRPTLIRTNGDNDLEASGVIWIDPETGRVLQTLLRTDSGDLESEIVVTYRPDERLGLWVPARMKETYKSASEKVEGTATYARFRQFKVETIEIIK